MGVLWPSEISPAPSVLARCGRALHWVALIILLIGIGLTAYTWTAVIPEQRLVDSMILMIPCAVIYLAGRGLRYVLAGE